MPEAVLSDRGVVHVAGPEARGFLQGLVTCDMARVDGSHAAYGALLTPQGKIIADFIVFAVPDNDGGGFGFDLPKTLVADFAKRLGFYRLRAQVTIADRSAVWVVSACWAGSVPTDGIAYRDPRHEQLGWRSVASAVSTDDPAAYHAHRIEIGIPEGGRDFVYGDAFPHEACMDQLGGVAFDKGCYVGQEVVSRMQHRATVRTRVVPVVFDGAGPREGAPIMAGDRPVGEIGSVSASRGLARLRLDKAADALSESLPLMAEGVTVTPVKPDWARFSFPGEA